MSHIPVLLLLGLPGSGTSEMRRYLASLDVNGRRELNLGPGPLIALSDDPYVRFMRIVDEVACEQGLDPIFFRSPNHGFRDPQNWITLTRLLDLDARRMRGAGRRLLALQGPAMDLFDRMGNAQKSVGAHSLTTRYPHDILEWLATDRVNAMAEGMARTFEEKRGQWREDSTIVIEMIRGCPHEDAGEGGNRPRGFMTALASLSVPLLKQAAILYMRVPAELARARVFAFHKHEISAQMLLDEFAGSDFKWSTGVFVTSEAMQVTTELPYKIFDNSGDATGFAREEPEQWDAKSVCRLHEELKDLKRLHLPQNV